MSDKIEFEAEIELLLRPTRHNQVTLNVLALVPKNCDVSRGDRFAVTLTPLPQQELKPCPFCGGEAEARYGQAWCIRCQAVTDAFGSTAEAISAWNERAG